METDDCNEIGKHMRNSRNPGEEPAPKKVRRVPPPAHPVVDEDDPKVKEAKATKQ